MPLIQVLVTGEGGSNTTQMALSPNTLEAVSAASEIHVRSADGRSFWQLEPSGDLSAAPVQACQGRWKEQWHPSSCSCPSTSMSLAGLVAMQQVLASHLQTVAHLDEDIHERHQTPWQYISMRRSSASMSLTCLWHAQVLTKHWHHWSMQHVLAPLTPGMCAQTAQP